jgi:hypothetical protein
MLNLIFLNPKMLVNLLSLLRGTLKLKIHFIFFCVVFKEHKQRTKSSAFS